MAAKKKAAKAQSAAEDAWGNPYVQRVVQDAELRDNVRLAVENARSAYARIASGKPASKLVDDKKLQKDLKQSAEALRDAAQALKDGPKKKRGGFGKLLIVGIIGAGLAIALSEDLRNKVLDALFGSEEEFDYSSTTAPPPPPAPAPAPPPPAPSAPAASGSGDGVSS